jgi:LDH2 family malate/lactate/ureidoglycolate dehydrogenase
VSNSKEVSGSSDAPRIQISDLTAFIARVFESLGFPVEQAYRAAFLMAEADAWGADAHGVFRLPMYVKRIQNGGINPRPKMRIVREQPATALLDGDNAMGHLCMSRAAEIAIEKARTLGVAWVGVRNSNHSGAGSLYARMPLPHDMIGIYAAVGGANLLPPWGGTEKLLSTNPLAIAVPGSEYPAIVLDMATTNASFGKIKVKAQRGEPMPEGWMIDREGNPLTDPQKALEGFLLPIGGAKGYGLALMIGLLGGILNGAAFGKSAIDFGTDHSTITNTGQLLIAVNIAAFADVREFKAGVDEIWDQMKSSPKLPGVDEVRLPGERSARIYEDRKRNGLPLSPALRQVLDELADGLHVPHL